MSSSVNADAAREQRKLEREERRRKRAAQSAAKTSLGGEKTSGKEERRSRKGSDLSSTNGSLNKKPPSGTKRSTMPSYDKVNIIEKTAKFDSVEKENEGKQKGEAVTKPDSSRKKLGSKFLDNLSKFEAKQTEEVKKTPFVRSFRPSNHPPSSVTASSAAATDQPFRRSYRTPRTTPAVDDPSVRVRRSLRKERVLDSIAKLERKSSTDDGSASKKKSETVQERKRDGKTKLSSRPSSASSSKASLSDSGSSTSSTKGLTRAQQALEKHRDRMRKSSQTTSSPNKPTTPTGKSRSTGKSKSRQKTLERTPTPEEPKTRKVSVTATPMKDDVFEVTTVTEVMNSAEEKMSIVVKEIAASEEESERLLSPTEGMEYELGDPRPVSVEDTVAKFSEPKTPEETPEEKPKRARRKLPELPTDQAPEEPHHQPSRKKKPSGDGNREPLAAAIEEQKMVVIETSPTFDQNFELAEIHSPPSGGNFQFSRNFNENSNSEQLSSRDGPVASPHGQNSHDEEAILKHNKHEASDEKDAVKHDQNGTDVTAENEASNKSYSPAEAIKMFRRLSEEVHFQPTVTKDKSPVTKSGIVTSEVIIEENDKPDRSELSRDTNSDQRTSSSEKRPSSLHIEEVLYISEETEERPKTTSPRKQPVEDIFRSPSPSKLRRASSKTTIKESSVSEASPSPQKSPKSSQILSFETPTAVIIEQTAEVTSPKQRSRTPSPEKQQRSLPKTPEAAKKSPVLTSPSETSPKFPDKDSAVPKKLDSPLKSPKKKPETFTFPVEPVAQVQQNRSPSPVKTEAPKSPIQARTPSPAKLVEPSTKKEVEPSTKKEEAKPNSTAITENSSPLTQEVVIQSSSPAKSELTKTKSSDNEMLAAGRPVVRRYQKSWLDESDDDNISLLSDADSDASSIDMDWLGRDASDDDSYVPKKSLKTSSGVQRTASSAQDMLKMWEKKATQPKKEERKTPARLPSDSSKRVGSVRAAWESKRNSSLHDSSQESIGSSEGKSNGHSHNESGSQAKTRSSPSTPRHTSSGTKSSAGDESAMMLSSGDWKPRASDGEANEMTDIFDGKVAGKIQGAKALFENLGSPRRSPSLGRSPRRKVEEKRLVSETADDVFPSRKSSISQASESSDAAMPTDSSDLTEDSPSVDNMRAMFENKNNKRKDIKKQKTSLAEMVAEDEGGDITDVRSIKAMWESMDNHR